MLAISILSVFLVSSNAIAFRRYATHSRSAERCCARNPAFSQ